MALGVDIVSAFDGKGIKQALEDFKKLETTGQKAQFALSKAALPATAALAGLAGAAGLAIKGAMEAEAQQARLTRILKNTTQASDEQIASLNKQAREMEKVGVASAGNITVLQSQLATFDLQVDTIQRLTPAITDYIIAEKGASASADEFRSMTNALASALNGQFGALAKSGFVLDEQTKEMIKNGTETERSIALVKVLNSTYKDFNITARETAEGRMVALRNSFDTLRDDIGAALLPIFEKLVAGLQKFADFAIANKGVVLALGAAIGTFSIAILAANAVVKIHNTYQALMKIELVKTTLAFRDAEGATTKFGAAVEGVVKAGAVLGLAQAIFSVGNAASGASRKIDEATKKTIVAIGAQKEGVEQNNAEIVANFANTARKIQDQLRLEDVFNEFGRDFQLLVDGVKVNIESADEAFTKFAETSPDFAQAIVDAMKAQLAVTPATSRAYQDLSDAIARYEARLNTSRAAQEAFNNVVQATPTIAFSGALARLESQTQREFKARLASIGAIEEWNKKVEQSRNKASGAAKEVKTFADKLSEYTSALKGNFDAQRSMVSATNNRISAEKSLAAATTSTAKAQEYFNNVTKGFAKNSREAINATRDYEEASRRARDAQVAQRDAILDVTRAEKRLAELRAITADPESVAEAERNLERTKYGVEEANFRVLDAETELAKLRATPETSPVEIRRAEIALAEAKLAVTDSVKAVQRAELQLNNEINRAATAEEIAEAERDLMKAKEAVVDRTDDLRDATFEEGVAQSFLNQVLNGATQETKEYQDALDDLNQAKEREEEARYRVAESILAEEEATLALAAAIKELNAVSKVTPGKVAQAGAAQLSGISTSNPALNALNAIQGSDTTAPINVTVNAGLGTDGQGVAQDIVDVLKQYERANGFLPLITQSVAYL